jgi:GT2 family glycosyltransferase
MNNLSFKSSEYPKVSIIIPCFEQFEYTLNCLESLVNNEPKAEHEIIIVDDSSPSKCYASIQSIKGIKMIRNQENLGFIGSCNAAAKIAKGTYLYFLNNDTRITLGAVDELLNTFNHFPSAGLVGSCLIYPNGRIQEAGALISSDGTPTNHGRFSDPADPNFLYLRSVDYCSGASLMIKKEIFNALGGFDSLYTPAYFEDADLAMKVKKKGYTVLYQPLSKVIHYEGVSNGRFVGGGNKIHQTLNQGKFYARWQDYLADDFRWDDNNGIMESGCNYGNVLFIGNQIPRPDQDAGSICELNLMFLFKACGWQPTYIPEPSHDYQEGYSELCQGLGIKILYRPWIKSLKQFLLEEGRLYKIIVIFRPETLGEQFSLIRSISPHIKIIYYPHDLHFLRFQREAAATQNSQYYNLANKYKPIELSNSLAADATIVLSMKEKEILDTLIPTAQIHVLHFAIAPNNSPINKSCPQEIASDLVFIGNFQHSPNQDAVLHFVKQILPRIKHVYPSVKFHIVGAHPTSSILELNSSTIIVHGYIESLDNFLVNMDISILPLRFGAGVKGKLGISMRAGLPIVSTSVGVEGVDIRNNYNVLIADNSNEFADAVIRLIGDQSLRSALSQKGLKYINESWGIKKTHLELCKILKHLGFDVNNELSGQAVSLYPFSRSTWPGFYALKDKDAKLLT